MRVAFRRYRDASFFFLLFCFVLFDVHHLFSFFFFFNDTATTEIYTLSLHDALPISVPLSVCAFLNPFGVNRCVNCRSEEHTSELQSQSNLVCRLLLEKKKKKKKTT